MVSHNEKTTAALMASLRAAQECLFDMDVTVDTNDNPIGVTIKQKETTSQQDRDFAGLMYQHIQAVSLMNIMRAMPALLERLEVLIQVTAPKQKVAIPNLQGANPQDLISLLGGRIKKV